jgi:hypothetical protein
MICMDAAVDLDFAGISHAHRDFTGAGLDVQVHRARYRERAIKMAIVAGQRRPGGHCGGKRKHERQQYGEITRTNSHIPSS